MVTCRYISLTSWLSALSSMLPIRRVGKTVMSAQVGRVMVDMPNVECAQSTDAAIVTLAACLPLLINARSGMSESWFNNSSVTRYHWVVPAACSYLTPLLIVVAWLQSAGSTSAEIVLAVSSTLAAWIASRSLGTNFMTSACERISLSCMIDVAVVGITVAEM